jgi:hypothetical protein
MRRLLLGVGIAAGSLLCASRGAAQVCPDTMRVRVCLLQPSRLQAQQATAAVGQEAEAKAAGKPAGEAGVAALTPTIDDFLPRLSAALLAPGLDTGVVGRLAGNFSLDNENTGYLPLALRIGAEFRRPEVYSAMLDSVAEGRRAAVRERFQAGLGELDDVELTLALNRESRRHGRRFAPHAHELELLGATYPQTSAATEAFAALAGFVATAINTSTPECQGTSLYELPMSCVQAAKRDSANKLVAAAGTSIVDFERGYRTWAKSTGWDLLPDLLNNQPQLSVHFGWRPRANPVGPESWAARLRYERGYVNLNSARNFCARQTALGNPGLDAAGRFTRDCFASFVQSQVTRGVVRAGFRGFVEAELRSEDAFEAPFEETDSASFTLPGALLLVVSGGIGGFLPGTGEIQGSRIDLGFTGERLLDSDADRIRSERRLSVSLSLTQRLNQNFSLLSGLVWSDRGEFADKDVTKIRLRLGVRYKLVPTPQSGSSRGG